MAHRQPRGDVIESAVQDAASAHRQPCLGLGGPRRGACMLKEPALEHPAAEDAKPPMKTWRVLFLDNPQNIEKLKDACKDEGYAVAGALTIAEAWAFLDGKDHVDVIVCAAHLEEESMFQFLKRVRDSKVHGDAKFLILALATSALGSQLHP